MYIVIYIHFVKITTDFRVSLLYIQPMSSVHLTKPQIPVLIFTLHYKCRKSVNKMREK